MIALTLDGTTGATRELVGGKGFGIDRMRALGLPVPPAFALTTETGRHFLKTGDLPGGAWDVVRGLMAGLERSAGSRDVRVSVRSSGVVSMPGMMDTRLNVGTWAELREAVAEVFASWTSRRAVAYRHERGIPDDGGIAVVVQAMVFGDRDARSGSGVLFTRDPMTGAGEPYGEWLARAQGEEVVSGRADAAPLAGLAAALPRVHRELLAAGRLLEAGARDVQDVEFTVESGRLWLLQTRTAKRAPIAAVRIAVAMCEEGLIGKDEAVARVSADQVRQLLRPRLDAGASIVLARGRPAGPGVGTGLVVTDPDAVETATGDLVLARPTTDPHDVPAMAAAAAVITELGGATSHAAVVCRELGVPCVVGCGDLNALRDRVVTVDGSTGMIYEGALPVRPPVADPALEALFDWGLEG